MKIIALDIDGVLNICMQERDGYGSLFHPHFEDNLRAIIEATGAKIVISSSWRHSGLIAMQEMWKHRGLAGEVVDITPICRQPDYKFVEDRDFHAQFVERGERGREIQEWLDKHPEVTSYVILDDDNDVLPHQKERFVRTSKNPDHPDAVDIGYGLTKNALKWQ